MNVRSLRVVARRGTSRTQEEENESSFDAVESAVAVVAVVAVVLVFVNDDIDDETNNDDDAVVTVDGWPTPAGSSACPADVADECVIGTSNASS